MSEFELPSFVYWEVVSEGRVARNDPGNTHIVYECTLQVDRGAPFRKIPIRTKVAFETRYLPDTVAHDGDEVIRGYALALIDTVFLGRLNRLVAPQDEFTIWASKEEMEFLRHVDPYRIRTEGRSVTETPASRGRSSRG